MTSTLSLVKNVPNIRKTNRSDLIWSFSHQKWLKVAKGLVGALQTHWTMSMDSFRSRKGRTYFLTNFYHPQRSLGQDNIFRSMCQEFCSHGEWSAPLHAGIHPRPPPPGPEAGTHPPRSRQPPSPTAQCMLGDTGNKRAVASYWNAFLFSEAKGQEPSTPFAIGSASVNFLHLLRINTGSIL